MAGVFGPAASGLLYEAYGSGAPAATAALLCLVAVVALVLLAPTGSLRWGERELSPVKKSQ